MKKPLHPHQMRALDMLRDSLRSGYRRPMLMAPTGFGKTILAAAIVEGALVKGKRVLFVAPFLSLIDQTVQVLEEQGIVGIGVIQGDHPRTDPLQPVQVASVQTLARRGMPKTDLVLIDEAHVRHGFLETTMTHPDWRQVPFVGLSATPWSAGLGDFYDDLCVAATTRQLIRGGFLAPLRIDQRGSVDLSGVRSVQTRLGDDFAEGELSKLMRAPQRVLEVVGTWCAAGENRPTLVFAVDRAHARDLAVAFEAAGVGCGYIDANTDRDERGRIGQRLREEKIRVVVNVGTLTTGVDWDVRCIVLARPTKSKILFVQIVGRGLRLADGKQNCLILDHSGTVARLGDPAGIHRRKLISSPRRSARGEGKVDVKRNSSKESDEHQFIAMTNAVRHRCGYRPTFVRKIYQEKYQKLPASFHQSELAPDMAFASWFLKSGLKYGKARSHLNRVSRNGVW